MAMVWMVLLSARSPPRLSRWRTVRPLLACSGLVPDSAANAASLRHRPGWEKLTMAWAAVTGPRPRRSVRPGARSLEIAWSWARLVRSVRPDLRRARDPDAGGQLTVLGQRAMR